MTHDRALEQPSPRMGIADFGAAISTCAFPTTIELANRNADFAANVVVRKLGGVFLVNAFASSSLHLRRNPARSNDGISHFYLQLQKSGSVAYHNGHDAPVCGPRSVLLVNARKVVETEQFGSAEALLVKIPVAVIRRRIKDVEDISISAVDASNGVASLLYDLILNSWNQCGNLTASEEAALTDALLRLTTAAFHDMDRSADRNSAALLARYKRVEKLVAEHLCDADLSVDRLARLTGMSRTSLYAVTNWAGTSVEKLIIDMRLEEIGRVLVDPAMSKFSITEIALNYGFQELAHFSRRFRGKFAVSPREHRLLSLSGSID